MSRLCARGLVILALWWPVGASAEWQPGAGMPLNYAEYVKDFNSGDDRGLVEKYFAEETVMVSASGEYRGHEGMQEFLDWAHDGVREILRPQNVLYDDHHIFAEVDMDFIASKERPEFPFGHLHPGDIITVKFFAHYTLNDEGLITQLQTMTWEPERGVTKAPRLGSHPGQQAAYLAYTKAFSAGDASRYARYYTDDVVLELSVGELQGRDAIVAFYDDMFQTVRETVTINSVVYGDHAIAADIVSTFTALSDAPDFSVAPLQQGESVHVPLFVFYTLRDGQISHIRVARAGEVQSGRGDH